MTKPLFQLGPRLSLCASLVRPQTKLADVGSDHAYLPIWLLKHGDIKSAVASDIRPGPLESAQKNIEKYHVTGKLALRLCDGLKGIEPQEADDIVIAGMGGELILRIIQEAPWLMDPQKQLVIQPMSSVPKLRLGLKDLGFQVCCEKAVIDAGKPYSAFTVRFLGKTPDVDLLYPYMGLLPQKGEAVKKYAEKVLRELSNQRAGLLSRGDKHGEEELKAVAEAIQSRYLSVEGA